MKWSARLLIAGCVAAVGTPGAAQEAPEMPQPVEQHEWLQKLAGEWETVTEVTMEPGQAPETFSGKASTRMVGGFWAVSEGEADASGTPMSSVLTLGYDVARKKYVGTWIDSMTGYLWKYEGTVDSGGSRLTLDTEGPCPLAEGELRQFREVIEFKGKDHYVFSSRMKTDDGKWSTFLKMDHRRAE